MIDVVLSIYEMSGTSTSRSYELVYEDVRCVLTPARPELMALYEDKASGQGYEFTITNQEVAQIKDQSKLVIASPQASSHVLGDVFITVSTASQQRFGGRSVITGLCFKTE